MSDHFHFLLFCWMSVYLLMIKYFSYICGLSLCYIKWEKIITLYSTRPRILGISKLGVNSVIYIYIYIYNLILERNNANTFSNISHGQDVRFNALNSIFKFQWILITIIIKYLLGIQTEASSMHIRKTHMFYHLVGCHIPL